MNIKFTHDSDPKLAYIRKLARADGYTTVAGLKEFVKTQLNAKLNAGVNGVTSISFNNGNNSLQSYLLLLDK